MKGLKMKLDFTQDGIVAYRNGRCKL